MPKISVIVPVYNTEKYLRRCVDSILAQTFTDFELLLIDDGSSDRSGVICDEYALKDSRIRVFHKKNGGVSSARNLGLDNATGEWITFVDSDDWISLNLLQNLDQIVLNYEKVNLVISLSANVYSDKIVKPQPIKAIISRYNFNELFTKYELAWRTSPWGKLYRKRIIDEYNIRFNKDMPIAEDLVFLYTYISIIDEIYISDKVDYFYNVTVLDSLAKKYHKFQTELLCMKNVHQVVSNLVKCKGISCENALDELGWLKYTYLNRVLISLYSSNIQRSERIEFLRSLNLDPLVTYIQYKENSIKSIISLFLLKNKLFYTYDFLRMINKTIGN